MTVDVEPPKCLAEPIHVPAKLLMGPGPSNASEKVLQTASLPLLGHMHTEFIKVKRIIQTDETNEQDIS